MLFFLTLFDYMMLTTKNLDSRKLSFISHQTHLSSFLRSQSFPSKASLPFISHAIHWLQTFNLILMHALTTQSSITSFSPRYSPPQFLIRPHHCLFLVPLSVHQASLHDKCTCGNAGVKLCFLHVISVRSPDRRCAS